MRPRVSPRANRFREKFADFVHDQCLWLLVSCYVLASVMPWPGRAMREWMWQPVFAPEATVTLPMLLLAAMLFCAALATDVSQLRSVTARPLVLAAGIVGVWLAPVLLFFASAAVIPFMFDGAGSGELLVGLAIVAAMPVANSSVSWTQLTGGNLALALALVLATICVCPWVTPWLVGVLQQWLAPETQASYRTLVNGFRGTFLIVWVIGPTACGLVCRYFFDEGYLIGARRWISLVSVAALLALNYINASLAFPDVFHETPTSLLAATALLAVAISAIGMTAGWGISRAMRLPPASQSALVFGLGMKHTGLALLLAGTVLIDHGLVILMIVLATLAQHVLAAIVEWRTPA